MFCRGPDHCESSRTVDRPSDFVVGPSTAGGTTRAANEFFVASSTADAVMQYHQTSGAFRAKFTDKSVATASTLTFGSAGLYVTGPYAGAIVKFDRNNGTYIEHYEDAGLKNPSAIVFDAATTNVYAEPTPGRCQKDGADYNFHYTTNSEIGSGACKAWCDAGGKDCVGYSWREITKQCAFHRRTGSSPVPTNGMLGARAQGTAAPAGTASGGMPNGGSSDTAWTCYPSYGPGSGTLYVADGSSIRTYDAETGEFLETWATKDGMDSMGLIFHSM